MSTTLTPSQHDKLDELSEYRPEPTVVGFAYDNRLQVIPIVRIDGQDLKLGRRGKLSPLTRPT